MRRKNWEYKNASLYYTHAVLYMIFAELWEKYTLGAYIFIYDSKTGVYCHNDFTVDKEILTIYNELYCRAASTKNQLFFTILK